MAILFNKTIKAQAGIMTAPTPTVKPADYWRQEMSDRYDRHLAHTNQPGITSDVSSPDYQYLKNNPLYIERQKSMRGEGMPGGWNYDRQSFKPGYFKGHFNEDYYKNMTDGSPEQLQSLHKQYNTPIPGKVTAPIQ